MKKNLLFLLTFFASFSSVHAQVVPSTCSIPQILADQYRRDIRQLAVKRLFQLQSPDTALVSIPQAGIDSIAEGLAAIFNATSIPERDSVFNICCVHNLNPFDGFGGYVGFIVKVDTNYAWTNAWQNLTTLTGDPLMDTILTRYHLTITNFYNWTIGNYAELAVDSSWNNFALIDSLEMVSGVLLAEVNSLVGVAGKISYGVIGNSRYYGFAYEWQDCFDGCDASRTWKFKVNADCSVEYLGFDEFCYWAQFAIPCDPIVPVNCNTFTSVPEDNLQQANFMLSPNPSTGKFQLTLNGLSLTDNSTVIIYTAQGKLIHQSTPAQPTTEIELNIQASGIYFVRIQVGQTVLTKKMIIQ